MWPGLNLFQEFVDLGIAIGIALKMFERHIAMHQSPCHAILHTELGVQGAPRERAVRMGKRAIVRDRLDLYDVVRIQSIALTNRNHRIDSGMGASATRVLFEPHAGLVIKYGAFLQAVINFLFISLSIFILFKSLSAARERLFKKGEDAVPEHEKPAQERLLEEIRDLLKENKRV